MNQFNPSDKQLTKTLNTIKRIPVAGPSITEKEISYVTDAVTNAWYENANMYHGRFEAAFAAYVGRKYAVTVSSCTAALHLALLCVGIGPGDEVIVPDITWIASAAPVTYVGATPVFADINEQTWCIDEQSFAAAITPRTKALIIVDLYGNLPDMDPILKLAQQHGIVVIEDAAEAIGSEYRGRRAGSFGAISTFSFHGSKTLTTGEGGMFLTDDSEIYQRCLFLRDHGRKAGEKLFFNSEVAYKYRMSSMQAALGLAQLERIEELLEKKQRIFEWYKEELGQIDGLTLNHQSTDTRNTYWMVSVILAPEFGIEKDDLQRMFSDHLIDIRPFFRPLSSLPAYAAVTEACKAQDRNTISYRISPYGINLPSALNLSREQVAYTCAVLLSILQEARVKHA